MTSLLASRARAGSVRQRGERRWRMVGKAAIWAAAILFVAAVVFAWQAWEKMEIARRATATAREQRLKAEDSEKNAKSEAGLWYGKSARDSAHEHDLGAAAVLWAQGSEMASMGRPEIFGYVAGQPMLSALRKFKFDAPARRLAWGTMQRLVLGVTTNGHLSVLAGNFQEPLWLRDSDKHLHLSAFQSSEQARTNHVLTAIPWRGPDGVEYVLASIKGRGLVRCSLDGVLALPQRILGADVNALFQDAASGSTWAGLATGIVVKLDSSASGVDPRFSFFVAPEVPRPFAGAEPLTSPGDAWRYEPLEPGSGKTSQGGRFVELDRRAGDGAPDTKWQILYVKGNKALSFSNDMSHDPPERVQFSPKGENVLLQFASDRKVARLFKLVSPRARSPGKSSGAQDDSPVEENAEDARAEDIGSLKLEADVFSAAFLDKTGLVALGDASGNVRLFQTKNGEAGRRIALGQTDFSAIDRLVASEDGEHLATVQNAEDRRLRLSFLRLSGKGAAISLSLLNAIIYPEGTELCFTRNGKKALVRFLAGTERSYEAIEMSSGLPQRPFAWESLASELEGAAIGGLALDAQGGLLAISCSAGMDCSVASARILGQPDRPIDGRKVLAESPS